MVKFRGAGQGLRALVAEVIVGELARRLGLLVPDLVTVEIDPVLGAAEPDPEIQDLITASAGANLGVDFLPGALPYTPAGPWVTPDERLAADIVWLDALTTNVDRTPRNPNLLIWHDRLWLIDHGAALYLHHGGLDPAAARRQAVPADQGPRAAAARGLDPGAHERLAPAVDAAPHRTHRGARARRVAREHGRPATPPRRTSDYLSRRLDECGTFAAEAERARVDA